MGNDMPVKAVSHPTQENFSMNRNSAFFNIVLVAILAILAVSALKPSSTATVLAQTGIAADSACDSSRSVQANGAAVVYVAPDRALIQLGVQSNGITPDTAQAANLLAVQRVINAVRALGIDAKDIATDYYLVYPIYNDYDALSIKGYRIDNTVSITLRDVALADDVLLVALKSGANEVQDVQFYTSELRKFRDQARDLAVKAASEKALALASAAGAQAGCVISIAENTSAQYYGSWRGGRATALWAQNTIQNALPSQGTAGIGEDSPITLGQIAVRAEVDANYSLK
jgi:uncharacterized protein